MGRKSKLFIAVKKVFSPEGNEKKNKKKSKRKWKFGKSKNSDPVHATEEDIAAEDAAQPLPQPTAEVKLPAPSVEVKSSTASMGVKLPQTFEIKLAKENEQGEHAYSVALASAVAAEAAAVAAQAAAEVVRLTASTRVSGKSKEEAAAIKIQTAFRGYQARRALRALRGLVRLKKLVEGNAVKLQTNNALHSMQTLARVQSQIRARRIRMREENQAFQRQIQLKRERELEKFKIAEGWDDSIKSKEQIDTKIVNKQEAAVRRERALAYAFSHQWKAPSRAVTPVFTDPNNPQWGWNWLERWMAARPWENRGITEISDHVSIKSATHNVEGQVPKTSVHRNFNLDRTPTAAQKMSQPSSRQSPSIPSKPTSAAGRKKPVSPRGGWRPADEDSRSMASMQSERPRRHSIAGSSVRDDESLASAPAIPSYMASTESARAKSRFYSPQTDKAQTPDKGSITSVKKRLSYPVADKQNVPSPGSVRRHSGPPKVEIGSIKEEDLHAAQITINGEKR